MNEPCTLNLLFSFAYLEPKHIPYLNYLSTVSDVLIDCGGFTNYWQDLRQLANLERSRARIRLEDYIVFCRELEVWGYIALDKLRDEAVTLANLDRMVQAGLSPIPVFVEFADWGTLPSLMQVNNRICVAGAVGTADDFYIQRCQRARKIAGPDLKIHALGFGRWPHILHVPIDSSDSSTWASSGRFGTCLQFDRRDGLRAYRRASLQDSARQERLNFLSYLNACHVSTAEMHKEANWWNRGRDHPSIPLFLTVYAYGEFIRHCWQFGKQYFLATAFNTMGRQLFAALAAGSDYRIYKRLVKRLAWMPWPDFMAAAVGICRAWTEGRPWLDDG